MLTGADIVQTSESSSTCRACKKSCKTDTRGGLIGCQSCPFVFHSTCAGYAKDDVVPSPWKCWSCAGGSEHWQHPKTPLQITETNQIVFVASDDLCEIFYHGIAVEHTKDTVTISWPEWPDAPSTRYSLTDNRLWRGNHFKNSWKKDPKDCSLRPISRVYAYAQTAAVKDEQHEGVKDEQQQEQQQQETKKRKEPSPSSAAPLLPKSLSKNEKEEAAAEEKHQAKKKSSGSSSVAATATAGGGTGVKEKKKERSNATTTAKKPATTSNKGQRQKQQVAAKTSQNEPLLQQVSVDKKPTDTAAAAVEGKEKDEKMFPKPPEDQNVGHSGGDDEHCYNNDGATDEPAGSGGGDISPKVPHSDENASQNQLIMDDDGLPIASVAAAVSAVDISIDGVAETIEVPAAPVEVEKQQQHRVKGKEVEAAQPLPSQPLQPPQATVASPSPTAVPTLVSVGEVDILVPAQRKKNKLPNLASSGGATTITNAALTKKITTKIPVLPTVLPRKEQRLGPLYYPPSTTTSKTTTAGPLPPTTAPIPLSNKSHHRHGASNPIYICCRSAVIERGDLLDTYGIFFYNLLGKEWDLAVYSRVTKDSSLTHQERVQVIRCVKRGGETIPDRISQEMSSNDLKEWIKSQLTSREEVSKKGLAWVEGDDLPDLRLAVKRHQGYLERSRLPSHPVVVQGPPLQQQEQQQEEQPPSRRKAATSTYQRSQHQKHQQEQALIAEAAGVLNKLVTAPVGPPPLPSTSPAWTHLRATSAARSLTVGSEVEIRWLEHDCGLRGAWFAATILEVAVVGVSVAPHFNFYRVQCVDLTDGDHAVREWLPIAVPAPWDSDELMVQIRVPATTAATMMKSRSRGGDDGRQGGGGGSGTAPSVWSTSWVDLRVGQRVEAWSEDAWWMGRISSIEGSDESKTGFEIEVEFDAPPLGEGDPKMKFNEEEKVRPAHPWGEETWFGMVEPDTSSIRSSGGNFKEMNTNQIDGALQRETPSLAMKPEASPTLTQCFATALGLLDTNNTNDNGSRSGVPVSGTGAEPGTKNLPLADAAARFSELLSFVNADVLKQAEQRARQIDAMEAETQARFERLRRIDEGLNARANYLSQQEQQQKLRERESRAEGPQAPPRGDLRTDPDPRKRKFGRDGGGEELLEWNAEREVYYRPEKREPINTKKQRLEEGANFKQCTKSEEYKCGRPEGHPGLCWSHKTASTDSNTVPKDSTTGNGSAASHRDPPPRASPPLPRHKKVQHVVQHERHRSSFVDRHASSRHVSSSSRAPPSPQYEDIRRGGPWQSEDLRERREPSPPYARRRRKPSPPDADTDEEEHPHNRHMKT